MNAVLTPNELANARLLAELSELAYRSQSEIQTNLASRGLSFEDFFNDPTSGTQGFLAKSELGAFFLFRGTEMDRSEDVIIDLLAWPVPAVFGKVHFGFWMAFNAIRIAVIERARNLQNSGLPVYIAGHSLGGAVAVLAAAAMADLNIPVTGLYTFGQPRVGNVEFEKHYFPKLEGRYYRFTSGQDIVPLLPLYFMGYRHWGTTSYHFSEGGELKKISSWWKWYLFETAAVLIWGAACSKKIRKFLKELLKKKSQQSATLKPLAKEALKDFFEIFKRDIIADHMMADYIKNLEGS